jgi:hypothetical protein
MRSKRILILSTYPIKNPKHGGQKRLHAIFDIYKENFTEVRHSAVFYQGFYSDFDSDDIALGREGESHVVQSPLTGDIIGGEAIYKDPKVKKRMAKLLTDFRPDIIHVEQAYAYLGLRPLLEELKMKPKLVFGSQNIEAPMKREILENAGVEESAIARAVSVISKVEKDLAQASDLVVACTNEDLAFYKSMNAKRLVLALNGINDVETNEQAKNHWQKEFQKIGVEKTAIFIGSGHPPNWTGFLTMIGKGLGFIPFNARIVPAGSICDYFDREILPDALNIEDATFWLRAYSAGRLSEPNLGALIEQADVILLPITEGGGSNLKTAEAILANKKVVATHHALRSYEWFADFPNLWLADNKEDFTRSITEALSAQLMPRTPKQTVQANQVRWDKCLAELVKEVTDL